MSNEQLNAMSSLRLDGYFLDNASICLSGCLKRSSTNEVKLKENRSVILIYSCFAARQNKTLHCSLLIAHCSLLTSPQTIATA
ncbi:MAG: hypothetical protein IKI11_03280 [Neisseriaceae bacterium]|nr:hypothetical protein [Neisseriaceae bacterium]